MTIYKIMTSGLDNYFITSMKKEMFDTIDTKVLKSFEIIKKVGQGAYGQVWKARNKKTGAICALKKIYQAFRNSSDAQKAYREIKYLQRLDHPSIVKLINIYRPATTKDIYLQLQFMEADLCIALKNSVLKEIHKHYIFYQLVNAVYYLHAAELIHRDIKPSNILVNETCEVKLCDLGLIRSLKKDNPHDEIVLTENIATRWYRAPQILLCTNNYDKAIDIWSIGCVLAEMILQKPIFQGSSTLSQLQRIFEFTGKPTPEDLSYLKTKSSLNVIQNMDIKQRKTMKELLNTNDKNIIDLLERIFQVNPKKRPTAAQILNHPFISKFRGKIEEKLPFAPIKILYQSKLLQVDDYEKLIFGIEEKDVKVKEGHYKAEEMIYKTMPTDFGRNNMLNNYPWGKIDQTSPLHYGNMGQKNTSPFGQRLKKEDRAEDNDNASREKKKERHSPSFLQNRKKQITPEKQVSLISSCRIAKKASFPLSYVHKKSESPQKDQPIMEITKVNSLKSITIKPNPEKVAEGDRKLQTIFQFKGPEANTQLVPEASHRVISPAKEFSKSKQKKSVPKFLLSGERKGREHTPNRQKQENVSPRVSPRATKNLSPIRSFPIAPQTSYNFRPHGHSPSPIQSKSPMPYAHNHNIHNINKQHIK